MIYEPRDKFEVETIHGTGIVLYIDTQGPLSNDLWCVANLKDGQIRHYQTLQLKLSSNHTIGVKSHPKLRLSRLAE